MATPQPAPAEMVGIMIKWPTQEGASIALLNHWEFAVYPTVMPRFAMAAVKEVDAAMVDERVPPPSGRWMPNLLAEPVALFVQTNMHLFPKVSISMRVPSCDVSADLSTPAPPACSRWMAAPAAEPAARLVNPQVEQQLEFRLASPIAMPMTMAITAATTAAQPALGDLLTVPAPEPVAPFVAQSVASHLGSIRAALHLPVLALSPAVEFTEVAEEPLVEPAQCHRTMRAAEPEAVAMYVSPLVFGHTMAAIALRGVSQVFAIPEPRVPVAARWMAVPAAEPVMMRVCPRAADTPVSVLLAGIENRLPDLGQLAQTPASTQGLALAASARSAHPVPAESWLQISVAAVQAIALQPVVQLLELTGLALLTGQPMIAASTGQTGAAPTVVESLLLASVDAEMKSFALAARMQPFALGAAPQQNAPRLGRPRLSSAPSAPEMPGSVLDLRPLSTISITTPLHQNRPAATAMPHRGIVPVEFHAHRLRGTPVCGVEWETPRIASIPPRFKLRPIFDRLDEELTRQKRARKDPAFAEVFQMPEARKRTDPTRYAVRAIAAALVVGAMWFGISMARLSRQSTVARQEFTSSSPEASPTASLSAVSRPAGKASPAQARGPLEWVRQNIASRAAYQASETFHNDMQAWGSAPKSFAAGWERNHEGYIRPGALAIFNPSRNFTDYRFEFFGQVEQKSMDWVVRAKDTNNYYAMKFKIVEAGLRPILAVVHYPVVGGKPGHRVETPLNVMVHNNKPFQVAVEVKGNHFSASIDGEEVDSWSDDALPTGGVGFFAEAGERSRLYWMKLSKNEDWLGSVCSMLAGSEASPQVTSELRGTGSGNGQHGGIPSSAPDGSGGMMLAAAGLGLPISSAKRTRNSKNRRYQPWSS